MSWWQRHIAWPGVTGYDDTPCVLLSSLTPAIYSSPGPRVCRALGCNWTLWPPISEYHRDHDRHTSTRPSSVFSVWRYNDQSDTNTNNDSPDQATEGQGRPVILTNCHSQHKQCVSITYWSGSFKMTSKKWILAVRVSSAWISNVCSLSVYVGFLVTSEHTAVLWQC